MITIIKKKIAQGKNDIEKINILREFLQIIVLKILSDMGAFSHMAFLGGTCLRIAFGLQRYSEDLDFSLYNASGYDFEQILKKLKYELEHMGFTITLKYKNGIVQNCFINFHNLLYDLGLTRIKNQNLSIKWEIDTNPPTGFQITNYIVNDVFVFPIKIFDLPSLMAGKLHAILFRGYDKGRDRYDLMRYLSKHTQPNHALLKNAILQTQKGTKLADENWKILLKNKIPKTDFEKIKNDVRQFLMHPEEVQSLSKEYFSSMVQ